MPDAQTRPSLDGGSPKTMKRMRQKFFAARELRVSIALIVLWSLLAVIFFSLLAKELGGYLQKTEIGIQYGVLGFLLVVAGYGIIVIVLSTLFTHRFIGPFQRLKVEIRMILAGEFSRRLHVRSGDDLYISSFIKEINRVLDHYENSCRVKINIARTLDAELIRIMTELEKGDLPPARQRESLLALHGRLKSLMAEPDRRLQPTKQEDQ